MFFGGLLREWTIILFEFMTLRIIDGRCVYANVIIILSFVDIGNCNVIYENNRRRAVFDRLVFDICDGWRGAGR